MCMNKQKVREVWVAHVGREMWPQTDYDRGQHSSVASPICQEGQSERIFPIFAFLIFSSFFPIFDKFFVVRVGTLPPLTPPGSTTVVRSEKQYADIGSITEKLHDGVSKVSPLSESVNACWFWYIIANVWYISQSQKSPNESFDSFEP